MFAKTKIKFQHIADVVSQLSVRLLFNTMTYITKFKKAALGFGISLFWHALFIFLEVFSGREILFLKIISEGVPFGVSLMV